MALNLSKTGIVDGQIITAAQITQSIDALTAAAAYNITISGSFSLTGNTTGSGYFQNSVVANVIRPQNIASSVSYTIPYLASTGSTSALYYAATGPTYNPVTETIKATNFEGTASFVTSASYALSSSYSATSTFADYASGYTYRTADDITFTASISPFPVVNNTSYNIYVSQSSGNVLGLAFGPGKDGQVINFTPNYRASNLDLTSIEVSAVTNNVFGLGGAVVTTGNTVVANTLIPITNNVKNLTFQYIAQTSPIHPSIGWYLINPNVS